MIFLIPLTFSIMGPYSVNDLAGWIAHGNYLLDHHEILRQDRFSVLPTQPLVYPAWAISGIYALLYRSFGLTGVCLFHFTAVLLVVLGIVYKNSLFTSSNPNSTAARFLTYFFWLGAVSGFGERPAMIALIPFLLSYLEISKIEETLSSRQTLKLGILNIIWVNIHGSFILLSGMLFWKILWTAIHKKSWKYVKLNGFIAAGISTTSLINPFHIQIFSYLWETATLSKHRMISEWQAVGLQSYFPTGLLYWILASACVLFLLKNLRSHSFFKLLSSPFFLTVLVGATAIRSVEFSMLALLPFSKSMGFLNKSEPPTNYSKKRLANTLTLFGFLALFVASLPWIKPRISEYFPPKKRNLYDNTAVFEIAAKIRKEGKTCPIFNSWETGSFLLLSLPNPIFVDGRNILFSEKDFKKYREISSGSDDWESYLNSYQACYAVLNIEEDSGLVAKLLKSPNWKLETSEKEMVLFKRL